MFEYGTIIYENDKPGEAEITICDYSAAKNILGWKAVKTLPEYIEEWIKLNK
jgi:nucleoside-diphosphate-sugar epimerase